MFTGDQIERVAEATSHFHNQVTDPKASIISALNTLEGLVCPYLFHWSRIDDLRVPTARSHFELVL